MTFKDLSNIIRKHKDNNNTTTIIDPVQKEVGEARALWQHLKTLHDEAHQQREQEWLERHPGKEFYQRTNEDDRRDCTFDEWVFDFVQELQGTPEQRYERERNPWHGFGHKSNIHGLKEAIDDPCIPGCRYYEKTGRIESLEILSRYKGYDRYDEVRRAWEELPPH